MLELANLVNLNFLHNLYKGSGVSGIRSTMSARNPLEAFNNSINDSDLKNILKWTYININRVKMRYISLWMN
jgi:hypothetical protein